MFLCFRHFYLLPYPTAYCLLFTPYSLRLTPYALLCPEPVEGLSTTYSLLPTSPVFPVKIYSLHFLKKSNAPSVQ
ncbi:MAG: hypothetical protein E3J41_05405 [Candidatus Cloacimonadota bacterium]|nr:MAG: hypothetical protein E3J41_05405 [Candidatus Cloacimonadota bacterium]